MTKTKELQKKFSILIDLENYEKEDFWLWGKSFLTSTLRLFFLSIPTALTFLYFNLSDSSKIVYEFFIIFKWIFLSYLLSIPFNYMLDKIWITFKSRVSTLIEKITSCRNE